MSKTTAPVSVVACLLMLVIGASPAQALNTRSFISANGLDTNSCARTAPCRTLQKAHDSTVAGGEINMLDPAGYGTVTINKSISIVNDGVGSAGVLVPSGGTGITINAGAGNVHLRGLIIEGAGIGTNGIVFNTGASLTIENCVVRNLANQGILFAPNAAALLFVSNSLISDIGNIGVYVRPSGSGAVRASLSRLDVDHNVDGIYADGNFGTGTIRVAVADSVVAGNTQNGITSDGPSFTAGRVTVLVRNSTVVANTTGLLSLNQNGGSMLVAQSSLFGNGTPWNGDGLFSSYGDNNIDGNDTGNTGLNLISKR